MWFSMIVLFSISVYHSIKYLSNNNEEHDMKAVQSVNAGVVFGVLGIITGAIWAKFTWGQAWSFDVKQNLRYCPCIVFRLPGTRNAIVEDQKRAKFSDL